MGVLYTENWDSYSVGALPSPWATSGGTYGTIAAPGSSPTPISTPNVLKTAYTGGTGVYYYRTTLDGNAGNQEFSAYIYLTAGSTFATTSAAGIYFRLQGGATAGVPGLANALSYESLLNANGTVTLTWKNGNAVQATLATTTAIAGGWTTGWYQIIGTAYNTSISVQVIQNSTGDYLTSAGVFQASQAYCIAVSDTNVPQGTSAGAGFRDVSATSNFPTFYRDDTVFQTAAAVAATGIALASAPASGYINQTSSNFVVSLYPPGSTTTGNVTITPSVTGVAGSFSPSTGTLNTTTGTCSFIFTPTANGTASITFTASGAASSGFSPISVNTSYVVTTPAITIGYQTVYIPPYVDNTTFTTGTSYAPDSNMPTSTQVTLQSTPPLGGANGNTVLFQYQWQQSASPNGTYVNSTGTGNSGTWTTLGVNQQFVLTSTQITTNPTYFRCAYTDGASTTAYSVSLPVQLWDKPLIIGYIGDSTFSLTKTSGLLPAQNSYGLTVGTGSTTSNIVYSSLAGTAVVGYNVTFSNTTTTVALQGVECLITALPGGSNLNVQLVGGGNLPAAPVSGDAASMNTLFGAQNGLQGGNGSTAGFISTYLQSMLSTHFIPDSYLRSTSAYNGLSQAAQGTYSSQWSPTGGTYEITLNAYNNVWQPAGVTDIICMLGMNDGVSGGGVAGGVGPNTYTSVANYQTNMLSSVTYLTSRGIRVSLVNPYPPNIQGWLTQQSLSTPIAGSVATAISTTQFVATSATGLGGGNTLVFTATTTTAALRGLTIINTAVSGTTATVALPGGGALPAAPVAGDTYNTLPYSAFSYNQIENAAYIMMEAAGYPAALVNVAAISNASYPGLCKVIDSGQLGRTMQNNPSYYQVADNVHPSPSGQIVIANQIAQDFATAWFGATTLSVTVTTSGSNQVIAWSADPSATSYNVLRTTTNPTSSPTWTQIANVSSSTLTYTDTAVPSPPVWYSVTSNH